MRAPVTVSPPSPLASQGRELSCVCRQTELALTGSKAEAVRVSPESQDNLRACAPVLPPPQTRTPLLY